MVNIEKYIHQLTDNLNKHFGSKLIYVGLQGSYLRGEATDSSDIDIMVVIDKLALPDLDAYRTIISGMEHFDKSCGFICGRDELKHWNPLEMCHLLHTTKDYFGCLQDLIPAYTEQDILNFVKMSVNNLYHEICHRFIHADEDTNLSLVSGSYRAVFFILQNLYCLNHGKFIATKNDLLEKLVGIDRDVLERAILVNKGMPFDFRECFELLFTWCRETIKLL